MADQIFTSWLETQYVEAMTFAQRSDVLSLAPIAGSPPYKYIAKFYCNGLAESEKGVAIVDRHLVGILFPGAYNYPTGLAGVKEGLKAEKPSSLLERILK